MPLLRGSLKGLSAELRYSWFLTLMLSIAGGRSIIKLRFGALPTPRCPPIDWCRGSGIMSRTECWEYRRPFVFTDKRAKKATIYCGLFHTPLHHIRCLIPVNHIVCGLWGRCGGCATSNQWRKTHGQLYFTSGMVVLQRRTRTMAPRSGDPSFQKRKTGSTPMSIAKRSEQHSTEW